MSATDSRARGRFEGFMSPHLIIVYGLVIALSALVGVTAFGGMRSNSHSMAPCSEGRTTTPAGTPSRSAEAALQPARILLPIAAHLPSIGILGAVHVRH
ncbi:hypothetical protein [Sphingomonas sp. BK069]|uniref:hypothetical protein n=1 Tax=Sphingomonas sp. BK069 TaxID=2586979 RepID=UPI0016092028|nr:hypothetical protein [Sphingomonas sp. BK069]MBB3350013.1 hypothetical protein [Sphingomonas sp. BK069]